MKKILLFLSVLFLFVACAPKPIQSTHTVERIVEYKTDSTKVTDTNKPILDSLFIQLAKVKTQKPECDSITQIALNNVLKQLNSRKKSGENEAGIYFNELKNQIVAWQKIAETKNEQIAKNKEKIVLKVEKQVIKVPVKYIPWPAKVLSGIGVLTLIYVGYRIARIWA